MGFVYRNYDNVQDDINNIVNIINGNIDNSNLNSKNPLTGDKIATSAITSSKIADAAVISSKVSLTSGELSCSGDLVLTDAAQDVTGLTTGSITYPVASYVYVFLTLDWDNTNANFSYAYMDLDGAQVGSANIKHGLTGRITVCGTWRVAVTAAAHTIKVRALFSAGGGGTIYQTHSRMTYFVTSQ